jgi:hypothetical protein
LPVMMLREKAVSSGAAGRLQHRHGDGWKGTLTVSEIGPRAVCT